jgi:hypothetical protein
MGSGAPMHVIVPSVVAGAVLLVLILLVVLILLRRRDRQRSQRLRESRLDLLPRAHVAASVSRHNPVFAYETPTPVDGGSDDAYSAPYASPYIYTEGFYDSSYSAPGPAAPAAYPQPGGGYEQPGGAYEQPCGAYEQPCAGYEQPIALNYNLFTPASPYATGFAADSASPHAAAAYELPSPSSNYYQTAIPGSSGYCRPSPAPPGYLIPTPLMVGQAGAHYFSVPGSEGGELMYAVPTALAHERTYSLSRETDAPQRPRLNSRSAEPLDSVGSAAAPVVESTDS